MKRLLALGMVGVCGCVTTNFSETVSDLEGNYSTTSYSAKAIVPPFSKLEPSNHNFLYEWEGNRIAVGQASEGIDATPQVEVAGLAAQTLVQIIPVLPSIIDALKKVETQDVQTEGE